MSRKNKFDLGHLVQYGFIKEGETIFFVSDPSKTGVVARQPNGDYKIRVGSGGAAEVVTVHALAQKYLGQDPPDHAAKWFRTKTNQTLYDLWQTDFAEAA